jgi:hypothetical protein
MPAGPITRLRRLCLALPGAEEVETWGNPTFRVRAKIFVKVGEHQGAPAVWVKAPPGVQEMLVQADPGRFFRPPYVGGLGWLGVVLRALVARSHGMTAPKALLRAATGAPATPPAAPAPRPSRPRGRNS